MEEAKSFRDRKRKVVPPVYNEARLSEKPLPVLVLVPDESANPETNAENNQVNPLGASSSNAIYENGTATYTAMNIASISSNVHSSSNSNNDWSSHLYDSNDFNSLANEFDGFNVSQNDADKTTNSNNDVSFHLDDSLANIEFDASNVLQNNTEQTANCTIDVSIHLDGILATIEKKNLLACGSASSMDSIDHNTTSINSDAVGSANGNVPNILSVALNSTELNIQVKQEPQFSSLDEEDCCAIANIFEESFEKLNESDDDILIHRGDVVPPPMKDDAQLPYKVKVNDVISSNIPFATNVSI